MKTAKLLLVAALGAAAFAAHADDADGSQYPVQFQGTRTRAEVQAELFQFKKDRVNPWSSSYNPIAQARSTRTRAEVQAEFLAARDQVAALNAEDSGSAYLAQAAGRRAPAGTSLAGRPAPAVR